MSGEPYTLRVLERIRDVPREAWDALVQEDSSPFVEWDWLDMLEQTGCVGEGTGWIAAHLSLWQEGKLVAAAPSYVKGNSEGEFVFDWGWADVAHRMGLRYYPKVVVAVPFTPATGDRVLVAHPDERASMVRRLAGAAIQWCRRIGASGVHVLFPREGEASAWEASGYLRRDGFQYHWFRDGAARYDDYLARLSSKQRNQVKREHRGVRERGITLETLEPDAHTPALARRMHGFYASTIDKHGVWGRMYLSERFFETVVERFQNRLAWAVARDEGGEVVAGAFNVVKGKRLYGRYWGAGVDVPYLHFAVCYYEGIRYSIERGLDVFEPGAGGEHKRARGFVPTLTRSAHFLTDPRLRALIEPWLERERAKVQRVTESDDGDDGAL